MVFLAVVLLHTLPAQEPNQPQATINLAFGDDYPKILNSGLSIAKGHTLREGVRTSDSIQDRKIRIICSPVKEFTLESDRGIGMIGVSSDETKIEFFSFGAAFPNQDELLKKTTEVANALGFSEKYFEDALKSDEFHRTRTRTIWQDSKPPYWAVEVRRMLVGEVYSIDVRFTWSVSNLQVLGNYYSEKDRLKNEK